VPTYIGPAIAFSVPVAVTALGRRRSALVRPRVGPGADDLRPQLAGRRLERRSPRGDESPRVAAAVGDEPVEHLPPAPTLTWRATTRAEITLAPHQAAGGHHAASLPVLTVLGDGHEVRP